MRSKGSKKTNVMRKAAPQPARLRYVYRYLPELDTAVHSEGLEAYALDGTSLAFNRKLAKRMSVLTLEAALELLGA